MHTFLGQQPLELRVPLPYSRRGSIRPVLLLMARLAIKLASQGLHFARTGHALGAGYPGLGQLTFSTENASVTATCDVLTSIATNALD